MPGGPIQNSPQGLLGILQSKQRGLNPSALADSYAGIVDVRDLFLLNLRVEIPTLQRAVPVVGGNLWTTNAVESICPPGELWYVWNFQVLCDTGAGGAMDMAPCVNGAIGSYALAPFQSAGAVQQLRVASTQPFWLVAGQGLIVAVRSLTLTPTIFGNAQVSKIRV